MFGLEESADSEGYWNMGTFSFWLGVSVIGVFVLFVLINILPQFLQTIPKL